MMQNAPQPWNPDRRWADLFITMLLLATLILVGGHSRVRPAREPIPDTEVTLQGRVQDALLGAAKGADLGPLGAWLRPGVSPALADRPGSGWDRAVLAVHAAEAGDLRTGGRLLHDLPGAAGEAFRSTWNWCYLGSGAPPDPHAFREVQTALGNGYAARILEARLLGRSGGDIRPLADQARHWAIMRLTGLAGAGLAGILAFCGGLGFALFLALNPVRPRPIPHYGLSGRAVLIVLLGWFLTLLAAGPALQLLTRPLPFLKPAFLPLVYGLHASLGVAYLSRAEGVDLRTLWRRVAPDRCGTALAMGLGYFALAFAAVILVSLALSPWFNEGQPPQKELLDLLTHLRGAWAVALLFITVAVVAPAFEELMFRGFLLPWLAERLGARLGQHRGRLLAVAVTGIAFGAMHLQPLGLPTLATLGIVLGFGFLRTGNLATSILVHGLWNGGVFLIIRAVS